MRRQPIRSIEQLRQLIEEEWGEVTDEQLSEWRVWDVPGAAPLVLPLSFYDAWDDLVDTVASAIEVDDENSSIGWIHREEICRCGDVWFIATSGDGPPDIEIVGEFHQPDEGLAASVRACEQLVFAPNGDVVPIWDVG